MRLNETYHDNEKARSIWLSVIKRAVLDYYLGFLKEDFFKSEIFYTLCEFGDIPPDKIYPKIKYVSHENKQMILEMNEEIKIKKAPV